MSRASGKKAYGFCDRTGFRWPLDQLKEETVQGKPTGFLVGPDVYDPDHPQNWYGKLRVPADAQALHNPRPDLSLDASRAMFSYDPVGVGNLTMLSFVGKVTAA